MMMMMMMMMPAGKKLLILPPEFLGNLTSRGIWERVGRMDVGVRILRISI
jgi:hypothetical protein